jgi:hypothetical protein
MQYIYSVRHHDTIDEHQHPIGTVMYSLEGSSGPWYDMVTGPQDYCWQIVDALTILEEEQEKNRQQKQEKLEELLRSEGFGDCDD